MLEEASRWEETCPLDKDQVTKAVKALKEYVSNALKKGGTKPLLDEHPRIQVQVTLHRVAAMKKTSIFIKLPHPLHLKNAEVCIITKDKDKEDAERTETYYREVLDEHKVDSVSRVLPIRQLRRDYKGYESRRALVDMYDVFLCDKPLMHLMPRLLGKHFLAKRKDPWPVNMSNPKLKEEITNALSKTVWYMSGNGSSSVLTAAKTTFSVAEIVENIMTCAVEIAKMAPRGWRNVKSLHVKTDSSIALPVYINDVAVDVDDFEKREVRHIDVRKRRREVVTEMWELVGIQEERKNRAFHWNPQASTDEFAATD